MCISTAGLGQVSYEGTLLRPPSGRSVFKFQLSVGGVTLPQVSAHVRSPSTAHCTPHSRLPRAASTRTLGLLRRSPRVLLLDAEKSEGPDL